MPNNLTFIVVGDVDARRSARSSSRFLQGLSGAIAQAGLHPAGAAATRPARGPRGICDRADAAHARLACPGSHASGCAGARCALDDSRRRPQLAALPAGARRSRARLWRFARFATRRAIRDVSGSTRQLDPAKRDATQELDPANRRGRSKQKGVTAEELAKAKKISLSHHLAALTTMRGQASDLGSNWLLTRNLNFTRDYLAAVQTVTRG